MANTIWASYDQYTDIFRHNLASNVPEPFVECDAIISNFIQQQHGHERLAVNALLFAALNHLRSSLVLISAGAVFQSTPLLRAAVEASVYALTASRDDIAYRFWCDRDRREDAKSFVRNKMFKRGRRIIEETDSECARELEKVYDLLISQGAHPNPSSIFSLAKLEARLEDDLRRFTFEQLTAESFVRLTFGSFYIRVLRLVAQVSGKIWPTSYCILDVERRINSQFMLTRDITKRATSDFILKQQA